MSLTNKQTKVVFDDGIREIEDAFSDICDLASKYCNDTEEKNIDRLKIIHKRGINAIRIGRKYE